MFYTNKSKSVRWNGRLPEPLYKDEEWGAGSSIAPLRHHESSTPGIFAIDNIHPKNLKNLIFSQKNSSQ
jgi:hypothetical protein